jgi:hypothetical protein
VAVPACVVVMMVVAVAALVVIVLVIMVVAIMVVVVMVVVVGGGIVVRLPGRVLVGVFVFDVIVAMGVRVAQSGHALRVSRGPRLGSRPGRDWPAARRVLMRSLRSARQ